MCLVGNYYGLGEIRKREMVAAARVFGVPAERVTVWDVPELQDSASWDPAAVAERLVVFVRNQTVPFDVVCARLARVVDEGP